MFGEGHTISDLLETGIATRPTRTAGIATTLADAADLAEYCGANASEIDHDEAFPQDEFRRAAELGLLTAPLPSAVGGLGLGTEADGTLPMLQLLERLGWGNLAVGRLYEGHVNALQLIATFGSRCQIESYAEDARDRRHLFGVWNTGEADPVRMVPTAAGRYRLVGAKIFASGAGQVGRPLVTAALPDGGWQMCVVPMERVEVAIDRSWWRPLGMRASASYRVDLTGVEVGPDDLIGEPGDYYRQPWFSGGSIRFAAVQLGGARALFDATRDDLGRSGRGDDPYQIARVGEAAIAVEAGHLWLRGAAERTGRFLAADGPRDGDAQAVVAYASMARLAIETICLDGIRLAERSIGSRGLMRPHPIERIVRDLTLYLRQPAPDAALAGVGGQAMRRADRGPARPDGDG